MVEIDGKEYNSKPLCRENNRYNANLLYYMHTLEEIEEKKKLLKRYGKIVKEEAEK